MQTIPILKDFLLHGRINAEDYRASYANSVYDNEKFWREEAKRIQWFKPFHTVKKTSFKKPVKIEWYLGGATNVAANCLDRHLPLHHAKTALIWEPDEPNEEPQKITYADLFREVCLMANVLKKNGVKKGDRVTIYLPMIPEAVVSMLACARIGAIHSVIFAGFSADAIKDRLLDAESDFVITATEGRRGGKRIPLKKNVDEALALLKGAGAHPVRHVLVVEPAFAPLQAPLASFELRWSEEKKKVDFLSIAEVMDAEDPLFMLYTSGSTGKPKGVLHTTGGYLVYAATTFDLVFDHREEDVFFCTADVGWITGHSYIVYGPLANAATVVLFEGTPQYPTSSRLWEIVDRHRVTTLYTAPTAIRALMREGEGPVKKTHRRSLRLLGSVGEPINPEAWLWYFRCVGEERCPIVDTWWQTETGGILMTPFVSAMPLKPGAAMRPFFGVQPQVLTPEGKQLGGTGAVEGVLVLKDSWPGQMRTIYKDHARFEETYFSTYPGYYFTGDGCRRDEDGDYWITGRVDDVLNVSGHRLGTAEIESALVAHAAVAEAAVVGCPHEIKGQGVYAFVILKDGFTESEALAKELVAAVSHTISPIAKPDFIQISPGLPKTRSGKIMRRILRKIANSETHQIGDTTTLADPSVVEALIKDSKLPRA